ncbi:acyl-CoA dehydrogenase [Aeromicrobium sp. SMF47]|uniref:acyl-CoA dehydrogenase family protein n=1 Tax=Aeromicrobium TaxID=2040 RepID=UPI00129DFE44|nr:MULTISPECIES: acyl-CoA dehydrogenase family protein [Aeromicrobium]MRJ77350.1 acyl-CoA dehydrogenase [Aeromicrobium yanjiei]MRK01718.1 acyl-CoA dehydrogenase [Aeromicrobium sp. S22]
MKRTIYGTDHEAFRDTVRSFLIREAVPRQDEWFGQGFVSKDFFAHMGGLGLIGMQVPEEFGGGGVDSYKFNAVLAEETAAQLVSVGGLRVHMDIILPYFMEYADDEQKKRWLPGIANGTLMTAIAMTEPGTGSDLAGIATTARLEGDHYVINGAKTFITGGIGADLVIVVARTSKSENRRSGLSLLVVEDGTPGFSRGRNLQKIGLKAQDTAELFFEEVRVPVENLLGSEGEAFTYLSSNLPQERLSISVNAVSQSRAALKATLEYVQDRKAFGQTVGSFQNTKFVLAGLSAQMEAAESLLDRAIEEHDRGELSVADAARVKLFATEMQGRVMDECLQLHGGYGYMLEYPIARMYADARVTRIYGGSSEIMKVIIAKSLGL